MSNVVWEVYILKCGLLNTFLKGAPLLLLFGLCCEWCGENAHRRQLQHRAPGLAQALASGAAPRRAAAAVLEYAHTRSVEIATVEGAGLVDLANRCGRNRLRFDVFEQLLRAQRCPSFEMIPIQVSTCFLPFVRETRVPDDYRRNALYNTQLKVRMPMYYVGIYAFLRSKCFT